MIVPVRKSAPLHAAPGASELKRSHSHGSAPLNSSASKTATSQADSMEANRLLARV